jgi:uncharacterized protein (TIGR03083 family)
MDSRAAAGLFDHRAQVDALTGVFAETLARTDPDAPLPSSRSWTVTDLAAHLGEVHRWAAEIVRTGRRQPRVNRPDLEEQDHVESYRARRGELLAALADTDPERACWTLRPGDRQVRFWHRRQTHETLVHLWDLRAAADPSDGLRDIDPAVCADGVDELLETFLPRAAPADLRPLAGPLTLVAGDAGRSWTIDPTWLVRDGCEPDAAASVLAPAGSLLLWAWHRPSTVDPAVTGDEAVVTAFRRSRFVP